MSLFSFLIVQYSSERLSGYVLLLNHTCVANRNKTSGEVSAKGKFVRLYIPFLFFPFRPWLHLPHLQMKPAASAKHPMKNWPLLRLA